MSRFKVGDIVISSKADLNSEKPRYKNLVGIITSINHGSVFPIRIHCGGFIYGGISFRECELELHQEYLNEQRIKEMLGVK